VWYKSYPSPVQSWLACLLCTTLPYSVLPCPMLSYDVAHCSELPYMSCSALPYMSCTILRYSALFCTFLLYTVHICRAQFVHFVDVGSRKSWICNFAPEKLMTFFALLVIFWWDAIFSFANNFEQPREVGGELCPNTTKNNQQIWKNMHENIQICM